MLLIVAVLCTCVFPYIYRAERQKRIVDWVVKTGGFVDFQHTEVGPFGKSVSKKEESWTEKLLGPVRLHSYLGNAKSVYIYESQVDDLGPLAHLTSLVYLQIEETQTHDIGPLAQLENLEALSLWKVPFSDLEPLSKLAKLRSLILHSANITSLSSLSDLKNLEHLSLINCGKVHDVSPLAGLTELRVLNLSRTSVSDLTPLVNMVNLERLSLDNTNVSDLTPLYQLKNLKVLFLSHEPFTMEATMRLDQELPNCNIEWAFDFDE